MEPTKMSEKHASQRAHKPNFDETAMEEANSASDALFDDFSQGARSLFRDGLQLAKRSMTARQVSLPLVMKIRWKAIQSS
jgi:hypothetical protein